MYFCLLVCLLPTPAPLVCSLLLYSTLLCSTLPTLPPPIPIPKWTRLYVSHGFPESPASLHALSAALFLESQDLWISFVFCKAWSAAILKKLLRSVSKTSYAEFRRTNLLGTNAEALRRKLAFVKHPCIGAQHGECECAPNDPAHLRVVSEAYIIVSCGLSPFVRLMFKSY